MEKSFGLWDSPIHEETLVEGVKKFREVLVANDIVYWIESRPDEGGRCVIMSKNAGRVEELLPSPFSARTTVHEYGGANLIATPHGLLFSNSEDQGIYAVYEKNVSPVLVKEHWRFADGVYDSRRDRLYLVGEHHRGTTQVLNCIASYDFKSKEFEIIAQGADFYAAPRLDKECNRLCYFCWNHPNMPWDGTSLYLAKLDDVGRIEKKNKVAGSETESICAPSFSPDGHLIYASDKTGFWNLYRLEGLDAHPLCQIEAEFAKPHWVFGQPTYAYFENQIAALYTSRGTDYMTLIDLETGEVNPVDLPFCQLSDIWVDRSRLVFIAGSSKKPTALVSLDFETMRLEHLADSCALKIDPKYFSSPELISFKSKDGKEAYGFFYPPVNPDFIPNPQTLPPLIVKCHGGPSACAPCSFDLSIQYWTSKGFAYLDLNYGGSTGFGRDYRNRLKGQWGVVDVDDACDCALSLADQGKVDRTKMAIRGGSAGGYTVLCALTFRDVFSAGASHYGVSNLELLLADTHKFEAHYLDSLIGPFPEAKKTYQERSPIFHIDRLKTPTIFFQGAEDKVVPPAQSEQMYNALLSKEIKTKYIVYDGEQHGFRQGVTIISVHREELAFYREVFFA